MGVALGYGTDDGVRARDALSRPRPLRPRLRPAELDPREPEAPDRLRRRVPAARDFSAARSSATCPSRTASGVLAEHSTIENANFTRFAVAGYRHWFLEKFELQAGLSYQIERSYPSGGDVTFTRALAPVVTRHVAARRQRLRSASRRRAQRAVRRGLQVARLRRRFREGLPAVPVLDPARHDRPVAAAHSSSGRTFADSRDRIPDDFLFRAGGSRSNRGYAYQSLGVQEGSAIVGGRFLATGTVEFVHWLERQVGRGGLHGRGHRLRLALDLGSAEELRRRRALQDARGPVRARPCVRGARPQVPPRLLRDDRVLT